MTDSLTRYQNRATGSVVRVDDETAKTLGADYEKFDGRKSSAADYSAMKVTDLRAEIARRNKDRLEADCLPDDGNKADLIAALEADDE